MNTVAQLVECFHIVESSIEIIDQLLTKGLKTEKVTSSPKAGKGVRLRRGASRNTFPRI